MELSQLKSILELAREFGVVKLTFEGVAVELVPNMPTAPAVANSPMVVDPKVEISDEDLLFWSVNGAAPTFKSEPEETK